MTLILAALLATVPPVDATGRAQLLPAGEFAARDGRPGPGRTWKVSEADGMRLAADINEVAARNPIVIDYEHQTLNAEHNGQPAPAAGWIRSVEWVPGRGLFATVEWTDKARAHIEAREYRFISPVIAWDKTTGRVVGVLNAALVNHPALLGMDSVTAGLAARQALTTLKTPHPPENPMDRAKLIAMLKLPENATDAQVEAAVAKLNTDLAASQAEVNTLRTQTDALRGQDAAAREAMQSLQQQVTALTAANTQRDVDALVTQALQAGKLLPAQRDWATKLGLKDLESLKAYIASAQAVSLAGQTGGKPPAGSEDQQNPQELARRATAYQAEQLKAGITVSIVQAMQAVTTGQAK
jgi:phage I-like protein